MGWDRDWPTCLIPYWLWHYFRFSTLSFFVFREWRNFSLSFSKLEPRIRDNAWIISRCLNYIAFKVFLLIAVQCQTKRIVLIKSILNGNKNRVVNLGAGWASGDLNQLEGRWAHFRGRIARQVGGNRVSVVRGKSWRVPRTSGALYSIRLKIPKLTTTAIAETHQCCHLTVIHGGHARRLLPTSARWTKATKLLLLLDIPFSRVFVFSLSSRAVSPW